MRRLAVVEANEVPLRVLRWYADRRPASALAELLATGAVGQSEVREDLGGRELYPSQTWASLATGVPYEQHRVYWYGDPKPPELPLYWQVAAQRRTVGVVGTLHSSPLRAQCAQPGVVYAVPDVFADDPATVPAALGPLQRFNLDMAAENARTVRSVRPDPRWLAAGALALRYGLRPSTAARLGAVVAGAMTGRCPRERLRTGQFLVMADVSLTLARRHDPDLAVFFTNHVAAAMHRYWYANFPGDWDAELYDDHWVRRYRGELPAAMDALDRFLGRLWKWSRATDRTVVIVSSMGQAGGAPLHSQAGHQLVVRDPVAFARTVGIDGGFAVRRCMVPSVTVAFPDEARAAAAARRLAEVALEGLPLGVDRNGTVVTWTYVLEPRLDGVVVDGELHPLAAAGIEAEPVEDHRCGTHHPLGSVVVAGSPAPVVPDAPFDYLELAPAILIALGVEPLAHHRQPSVVL
jgi:hypothetical protein